VFPAAGPAARTCVARVVAHVVLVAAVGHVVEPVAQVHVHPCQAAPVCPHTRDRREGPTAHACPRAASAGTRDRREAACNAPRRGATSKGDMQRRSMQRASRKTSHVRTQRPPSDCGVARRQPAVAWPVVGARHTLLSAGLYVTNLNAPPGSHAHAQPQLGGENRP
jgi:hypothetical protein